MQGPAWLSLLRRLPPDFLDGLLIVTSNAAEIVVQSVLRAERDLLIVRGRMSGTQDTGRMIFIPFDQINYMGLTKKPTEAEIQEFLAKPAGPIPAGAATATMAASAEEFESFVPEAAHAPEPAPAAEPHANGALPAAQASPKPAAPSKSILLARLRARLAGDGGPKPPDA